MFQTDEVAFKVTQAVWCCVNFVLVKLIKVYFFYIFYCTAVLFLP